MTINDNLFGDDSLFDVLSLKSQADITQKVSTQSQESISSPKRDANHDPQNQSGQQSSQNSQSILSKAKSSIKKNFSKFLARNIQQLLKKVLKKLISQQIDNGLLEYLEKIINQITGKRDTNFYLFQNRKDRWKNLGFSFFTNQRKTQVRQILLQNIEFFKNKAINKKTKTIETQRELISAYCRYVDLFRKCLVQNIEIPVNRGSNEVTKQEEWHGRQPNKQKYCVLISRDHLNREEVVKRMIHKKVSPFCTGNLSIDSEQSEHKK